jgi:hypothetical protein
MDIVSTVRYQEKFDGLIFNKDFFAKNYIGCEFNKCNLLKVNPVEILKLFESDNIIINCVYDPTIILSKIVKGLHRDVNLIDSLNKAFIKNDKNFVKDGKQLILIDLN